MEWVLCSQHFNDMIWIAPECLNYIPITSQYKGIFMKQIKKEYFDLEHPKPQCLKRKDTMQPSGNIVKETIR